MLVVDGGHVCCCDVLAGLAVEECGPCAGSASRLADSAVVVVGCEHGVVKEPQGTLAGALAVVDVEVVPEIALSTVGRVDGTQQAFGVAGHAEVGEESGDELAIGAHLVASGGI